MGGDLLQLAQQVGGDQYSAVVVLCDVHQDLAHDAHTVGVQTIDGLVQDQQGRITQQGHGDAHPLLHAQTAFFEFQVGGVLHADDAENSADLSVGIGEVQVDGLHHQVVPDTGAGETARVLDQGADPDPDAGVPVVPAEETDLTAVGDQVTADELFRGGFAGSILADKAVDRPHGDCHVQAVHGI